MIQRKLDILNKAGLSKDNFMESESHSRGTNDASSKENKITDFFSTTLTDEDIAALDVDWNGDGESNDEERENVAKKPRL